MMNTLLQAFLSLAFGLTALVPSANVSQWVMVIPEYQYSIDQGSIQRNGDLVTFSGRYANIPEYAQTWLQSEAPGAKADYLVDKTQINCMRKSMRYLQDAAYRTDGTLVASVAFSPQWKTIVPGSMAEAEWEFVCFQGPWPLTQNTDWSILTGQ